MTDTRTIIECTRIILTAIVGALLVVASLIFVWGSDLDTLALVFFLIGSITLVVSGKWFFDLEDRHAPKDGRSEGS